MTRLSKDDYYLDIALQVAQRGTCLRRRFGAVIVQNDEIISTGYVGAPRGTKNCLDLNFCPRQQANIPKGERYELCRSVHAEANAIISARRQDMIDSTLYLSSQDLEQGGIIVESRPCKMCTRLIINAGIKKVIVRLPNNGIKKYLVEDWIDNDEISFNLDQKGY